MQTVFGGLRPNRRARTEKRPAIRRERLMHSFLTPRRIGARRHIDAPHIGSSAHRRAIGGGGRHRELREKAAGSGDLPQQVAPQTLHDALFQPGNIGLRNAEAVGDLLLRLFRASVQSEP